MYFKNQIAILIVMLYRCKTSIALCFKFNINWHVNIVILVDDIHITFKLFNLKMSVTVIMATLNFLR